MLSRITPSSPGTTAIGGLVDMSPSGGIVVTKGDGRAVEPRQGPIGDRHRSVWLDPQGAGGCPRRRSAGAHVALLEPGAPTRYSSQPMETGSREPGGSRPWAAATSTARLSSFSATSP